jgi:hypothetical protein
MPSQRRGAGSVHLVFVFLNPFREIPVLEQRFMELFIRVF